MDLSKFVEQKKQEKKEIAEAERIRITAEHEEEMRKEAEARVREDVLHQLADFEKQEEIKRKIGALEQEKKDILDSLAGWKTGREEMVSAAKATREKRRGLKKTVEEGKEFFAEEGVKDVKGLLKSEKFAGAGEVQSYQEAEKALLEKVKELKGHRRKATDQERGHLSKAEKEIAKKIEKINKEIQELHEQTPEGQLEIKKSAVKEIQERHGKLNRYVLDKHDGLHATNFVTQEDLKLIPKAGEGLVRETILKHYLAQLDKQLKEDNSDVFVLDKELRQMEKLPERMEEANRALEKLEKAQREAEASMRKNLEDKGDIEKVGITGSLLEEERVQKAIQNYVDSYLVNLVVSRRRNTDEHTPELKELLRAKYNQRLLQDFKTYSGKDPSRILNLYRGKEIDTRQETRFAFSFANPEYVIEMAKIFTDFLKKLATLLEKNTGSVLAHLEDPQFQPLYKPLEKIEQEREFSISRPTYDALNEGFSSLQNAGYRISNFEGHQKKTGEAVEAKFEKDWDEAKLQELDKDKRAYEITQKKRDIDIWKERAQKVLSQLPEVRLNFKDRMGEEIAVSHLDYSKYGEKFSLACIEKQKEGQKLDEEAQELQKSVELLKEEIKLRKIGEPRWLGREKYMAKTEELGQKLYELEQEIRTTKEKAREAYQSASSLVRELSEILRLSGIIDEAVKGKDFTVRELLGLAENKARENSEARLSPSEEVVYKKRLELEEAVERALQKIRKIYPNY